MTDPNRLETYTTPDGWMQFKLVDGLLPIEPRLVGADLLDTLAPVEWGDTPEGVQTLTEQAIAKAERTNPGYHVKEDVTPQSVVDAVANAINKS